MFASRASASASQSVEVPLREDGAGEERHGEGWLRVGLGAGEPRRRREDDATGAERKLVRDRGDASAPKSSSPSLRRGVEAGERECDGEGSDATVAASEGLASSTASPPSPPSSPSSSDPCSDNAPPASSASHSSAGTPESRRKSSGVRPSASCKGAVATVAARQRGNCTEARGPSCGERDAPARRGRRRAPAAGAARRHARRARPCSARWGVRAAGAAVSLQAHAQVRCGHAILVACVKLSASSQQQCRQLARAGCCCAMQRRQAEPVRSVGRGAVAQQPRHARRVLATHGFVQLRLHEPRCSGSDGGVGDALQHVRQKERRQAEREAVQQLAVRKQRVHRHEGQRAARPNCGARRGACA